jgi:hypothetical protein
MTILLYMVEVDGARWAVLNVTFYALSFQYGLKLINETGERMVCIDEDTYRELFNPQTNPPQPFVLKQGGSPAVRPPAPPPEHSKECLDIPGPACIDSCPVAEWYVIHNMEAPR